MIIEDSLNNYNEAIFLLKESLGLHSYYDTNTSYRINKFLNKINNGRDKF